MARNPFPIQRIFGGMPLSADFLNGLMQRLDYIIALMPEGGGDDRPGTEALRSKPETGRDGEMPEVRSGKGDAA